MSKSNSSPPTLSVYVPFLPYLPSSSLTFPRGFVHYFPANANYANTHVGTQQTHTHANDSWKRFFYSSPRVDCGLTFQNGLKKKKKSALILATHTWWNYLPLSNVGADQFQILLRVSQIKIYILNPGKYLT